MSFVNPRSHASPTCSLNQWQGKNELIVVPGIANQNANQNGNGNVVAARAEGNGNGNNKNHLLIAQKEETGIQIQAEEFDLVATTGDLDEIVEVNANCILMTNLQQASTLGNQTDKAPVYDPTGPSKEQYTELLEPISEPYQVQQNDNNVISAVSSVEQSWGIVEQNLATVEETHALYDSFYNNLAIEQAQQKQQSLYNGKVLSEKHDPLAVYNSEEILQLAQERVDNTAKTRRPQPRSNTKNDRFPSMSKSSCIKNKEVEVEEHHRNLLLSKNKKHMSSECNNIKLAIRNDKSNVVCAM
ncbi:hypothetical protein Tco_1236246, partial [Tanacetum coccineum]